MNGQPITLTPPERCECLAFWDSEVDCICHRVQERYTPLLDRKKLRRAAYLMEEIERLEGELGGEWKRLKADQACVDVKDSRHGSSGVLQLQIPLEAVPALIRISLSMRHRELGDLDLRRDA